MRVGGPRREIMLRGLWTVTARSVRCPRNALVRGCVTVLGTHKRGEPVLLERHCQQQPGEQLHAGFSDTELLEQLVPVAIEAAHRSLAANSVVPVSVFFGTIDCLRSSHPFAPVAGRSA